MYPINVVLQLRFKFYISMTNGIMKNQGYLLFNDFY
jgi:hypothetical protein